MVLILFIKVPLLQWLRLWSRSMQVVIPVLELSSIAPILFDILCSFLVVACYFIILCIFLVMFILDSGCTIIVDNFLFVF